MKLSVALTKKFFTVVTIFFFTTHSAFAALVVNNGTFSNLT